jgi:hypothetical protein
MGLASHTIKVVHLQQESAMALSNVDETFIRQTATTFMAKHHIPGLSLALTRHGRLVFAQGYGVSDPATGQAVGTGHLFRIASVSKPIIATTVFRLMDADQLNLGDRIFGANGILGTRFGTAIRAEHRPDHRPASLGAHQRVAAGTGPDVHAVQPQPGAADRRDD